MILYNDNDACAAQWLTELMSNGLIGNGTVLSTDIRDILSDDISQYDVCHFFAGIGGWELARQWSGWEGSIWTASLPCQPFSTAGKQNGVNDERHLWPYFRDLITQCLPPVIVGEQAASKPGRAWLAAVQADLEALGYAVVAADLCAAGVGAPHIRQRLYWGAVRLADASSSSARERGEPGSQEGPWSAHWHNDDGCVGWADAQWLSCADGKTRPVEPGLEPLAHGIPGRVGLLRGYGNAIVPQVAAAFLGALKESLQRPTD